MFGPGGAIHGGFADSLRASMPGGGFSLLVLRTTKTIAAKTRGALARSFRNARSLSHGRARPLRGLRPVRVSRVRLAIISTVQCAATEPRTNAQHRFERNDRRLDGHHQHVNAE